MVNEQPALLRLYRWEREADLVGVPGIVEYIEVWYNRRRPNSALGYVSPEAFVKRPIESKRESFKSG
jgi:transposase InsO family protein